MASLIGKVKYLFQRRRKTEQEKEEIFLRRNTRLCGGEDDRRRKRRKISWRKLSRDGRTSKALSKVLADFKRFN